MTDKEFLSWIYNRMIYKYGENENVDYLHRFKRIIDSLQEEPISEELEKAANKYAKESYPDELSTGQFGTGDYEPYVDMSWQRECAVEDFKAGAEWKKEQMMAKAIDAHCFGFQGAALFFFQITSR